MKKIRAYILVLMAVLFVLPQGMAMAEDNEEIIYTDDGGYIEVSMDSVATIASGTAKRSFYYTAYASDDSVLYKITLTGTFTFNGVSATCISSVCDVEIYNSNWYLVSKTATKSGNTANATVVMGFKFLGVTLKKETFTPSLSCDKDGNVT